MVKTTGRKTSCTMRHVKLANDFSHQESMVKVYREYIHARLRTAFYLIGIGGSDKALEVVSLRRYRISRY